jgi:hypothetical protein
VNLEEQRCECVDWIHLAQDRDRRWTLVSMTMEILVPYGGVCGFLDQLAAAGWVLNEEFSSRNWSKA